MLKNIYSMMNPLNFAKRFKRRSWLLLPTLLVVCGLVLSLEPSVSRAQPVDGTQTLVFLRHAEKPAGGLGQLNCQGLNRAIDLATLLPEKFGKADYVFAANPTRNVEEGEQDNSYSYIRPLMTISPSAIKLGLPVNINYSANDTSDLADELLHDKYHNATVYTAWSHGYLPELINKVAEEAVGEKQTITDDWASSDFDSLFVLTLTWHNGKASLTSRSYKQGLDNGKEACPT
ncbi:hypothetical protein J2W43_002543 [Pseudomonas brassicacearum]|uniref:Histidine phosphatase family protein n=2 Tax=Pseudomonas brassicacearum TaxID=930166 RepID=A0AAW8M9A9_9PSED|nr:hypothetical protein [Pseudomonas brassicacearum]